VQQGGGSLLGQFASSVVVDGDLHVGMPRELLCPIDVPEPLLAAKQSVSSVVLLVQQIALCFRAGSTRLRPSYLVPYSYRRASAG
jgi:hypothetical protein